MSEGNKIIVEALQRSNEIIEKQRDLLCKLELELSQVIEVANMYALDPKTDREVMAAFKGQRDLAHKIKILIRGRT